MAESAGVPFADVAFTGAGSYEYAPEIIHSMVTGTERVIYGNVVDDGLIPQLPARCAVEVAVLVHRRGLRPEVVRDDPPHRAAMLDANTAATLTLDEIDAVGDELLAAHAGTPPAGL